MSEIDSLRAEVAALRAELAERATAEGQAMTRRRLLTGLAGLGAAGAASVAAAAPAGAADNGNLVLGQANTSTLMTTLTHTAADDEEPAVSLRTSGGLALFATTDTAGQPVVGNVQRAILAAAGEPADGFAVANAISAFAGHGFAVEGGNESPAFPAVAGTNQGTGPGLGAASYGHGAQLLLFREDLAPNGPPTTYSEVGSLRFDGAGDLWLCLSAGAPGTWTRLLREDTASGRTIPITPFRALDTRESGSGPIKGGQTITHDFAAEQQIPDTATGVVGNLIAVAPSYTGYVRAAPSGQPLTSTAVSFTKGTTVGNAFTVQLGPNGVSFRPSGTTSSSLHLVVDITAYIT